MIQNKVEFLIIILVLIIITLSGFVVYLLISRRKVRIQFNKIEQQLLLSQMNPHFVFNSLTAIQSYIFRNDSHLAGKYLSSFAKLVRLILENSRLEVTSIEQEIKTLRLYLDLQALRFEGKFDYTINVDEDLDIDSTAIPPMLAQPFIENAIEHGIIHLSEKGTISVSFKSAENAIILEVEDNGIGIEKSKLIQLESGKDYKSLATEITFQRLKKIKYAKNINIDLSIIDLNTIDINKQGTLIRFTIPLH
ncbi:MAG: sensor histidine kinase [Tenuifilaceae bacterium]